MAPAVPLDPLSGLADVGRRALGARAVAIAMQAGELDLRGTAAEDPDDARTAVTALDQALAKTPSVEGAALFVGIERRGELVGGLIALPVASGHFSAADWQTAGLIAWQSAELLDRSQEAELALSLMHALGRIETSAAAQGEGEGDPTPLELQVVRQARRHLGFASGALYLRRPDQSLASLICTDGQAPDGLPAAVRLETPAAAALAAVDSTVLPLQWGGELEGWLLLYGPEAGVAPAFSAGTLAMVGARLSAALGTAGLIRAERRHRRMAEALHEASQTIDRELELSEVLDRILDQVMRAFPCDAANFMSYEGDTSHVLHSRGYERFGLTPEDMAAVRLTASDFPNLKRLADGQAVTIPDTHQDPAWIFNPNFEWLRSWAGVPVRYGDRILGFVMLDSATAGTFDVSSAERLQAFAAHAGAAMHNARLYSRLVEEHTRLRQVHTIGRRFSGSLNRDEIIEKLGIATQQALGGRRWEVFVPSRQPAGHFEPAMPAAQRGAPPPLADTTDHEWIANVADTFGPDVRVVGQGDGRQTLYAFPLTAGDRTFAVAVVGVDGESAEPESWLDVLRPVGQQAGLALASAEEHAAVQRRLAELTALQAIVRHIAGRLEVEAVLREVTTQLHTNLGFPVVQVFMRDGEDLMLRQYSGSSTLIVRTTMERGIVGRAARTGRPQFVPDVRLDPDYTHGLLGTRAEAAVPILAEGAVIGVLNVETSEPEQLDRNSLDLLILLADQLSIALQNAELYESAQTNLEALEARVRERTAQLEQVLEQAVAAERVKAQFVADVSHELRTPLTNIGLYLDLLELSGGDRRAEYMATLRRETERLARLIEQLLAMSHLDTGQAELRRVETDLNGLVKVLVGDRARLIARKGLRLEVQPDPDLPMVYVDPQYLMQVLTNLLSNAVNYTPDSGRIALETGRAAWQGAEYATLTVRDTGPGIPDEEQAHVFDRFYRGLNARASGVAGTGLGLAISKEILERHGGRLTLSSRVGEGSAFSVWIPLGPPG